MENTKSLIRGELRAVWLRSTVPSTWAETSDRNISHARWNREYSARPAGELHSFQRDSLVAATANLQARGLLADGCAMEAQ